MELVYKYITVGSADGAIIENGKPLYGVMNNRSRAALGGIMWYPRWRLWVFNADPDAIFSADCLADIQDAIAKITAEEK